MRCYLFLGSLDRFGIALLNQMAVLSYEFSTHLNRIWMRLCEVILITLDVGV